MEPNYVEIGQRIREIRKQNEMTQDELSRQIDISPSHMSHIESGKTKVSLPTLFLIAESLGTTIDALVYGDPGTDEFSYTKEMEDLFSDLSPDNQEFLIQSTKQLKAALQKKD